MFSHDYVLSNKKYIIKVVSTALTALDFRSHPEVM